MKRSIMAIIIFALVTLILCSCGSRGDYTDDIDGGVQHYEDTNAPKVIESTRITSFSCTASTVAMLEEDTPLAGGFFTFQATKSEGYYNTRGRGAPEETFCFVPDEVFWEELQQIVAEYDFCQYNGTYYSVSGLPENFGSDIEIIYESGESISASDNQTCFLPIEALEAINELFLKYRQK